MTDAEYQLAEARLGATRLDDASRERLAQLCGRTKKQLVATWYSRHAHHHWTKYPVSKWTRQEIIDSIIRCEFPDSFGQ
jgi:hypothetical protein